MVVEIPLRGVRNNRLVVGLLEFLDCLQLQIMDKLGFVEIVDDTTFLSDFFLD